MAWCALRADWYADMRGLGWLSKERSDTTVFVFTDGPFLSLDSSAGPSEEGLNSERHQELTLRLVVLFPSSRFWGRSWWVMVLRLVRG